MCQFEKNSPGACVKSGFWGAPRRESQSQEDMALLFYLLTCPERSPVGIAQFNWGISAARLKWDRLQLLTVLDRLETQQEIIRSDNWLFVTTWWDHNSLPGPGLEERINALLVEVPKMLVAALIQATKKAYQGSSIWLLKLPILCDELSVGSTGVVPPLPGRVKTTTNAKTKTKATQPLMPQTQVKLVSILVVVEISYWKRSNLHQTPSATERILSLSRRHIN